MKKAAELVARSLGLLLVCSLGITSLLVGSVSAQERNDTPWLGVYSQSLNDDLREGLNYSGEGVLINRVISDSPADRAGVEKGDVLVSVNLRTVASPRALAEVVRGARVGQQIQITVVRDGSKRTLSATLKSRPEGMGEEGTWTWRGRGGEGDGDVEGNDDGDDHFFEAPIPPVPPVPPIPPVPGIGRRFEFHDGGEPLVIRTGRGRLGVRVDDLNGELGEYFSVPDGKGALIVEVMKDTPAERAGLKAGDVITRVGEKNVADASDLIEAVSEADGKVTLRVLRKGQARSVETELAPAPRAFRMKSGGDWMGFNQPDHVRILRDLKRDSGRSDRRELRDDGSRDDLRDELRELREQLRDLREDLDRMDER